MSGCPFFNDVSIKHKAGAQLADERALTREPKHVGPRTKNDPRSAHNWPKATNKHEKNENDLRQRTFLGGQAG